MVFLLHSGQTWFFCHSSRVGGLLTTIRFSCFIVAYFPCESTFDIISLKWYSFFSRICLSSSVSCGCRGGLKKKRFWVFFSTDVRHRVFFLCVFVKLWLPLYDIGLSFSLFLFRLVIWDAVTKDVALSEFHENPKVFLKSWIWWYFDDEICLWFNLPAHDRSVLLGGHDVLLLPVTNQRKKEVIFFQIVSEKLFLFLYFQILTAVLYPPCEVSPKRRGLPFDVHCNENVYSVIV